MNNNGIFLKEMGVKVRIARKAKGINLRDFGKLCDIDFGAISEIENGKRNSHILTLKMFADVLNVDVKDFF